MEPGSKKKKKNTLADPVSAGEMTAAGICGASTKTRDLCTRQQGRRPNPR